MRCTAIYITNKNISLDVFYPNRMSASKNVTLSQELVGKFIMKNFKITFFELQCVTYKSRIKMFRILNNAFYSLCNMTAVHMLEKIKTESENRNRIMVAFYKTWPDTERNLQIEI